MERIRVVLVDDSEVFLGALASWFEQCANVEIVGCAASGADGLSLIESNRPDLVLMDIFMPVMNGLQASRRIERSGGLPKVVLMTSLDDAGLHQMAMDANADAYIGKQDLNLELPRRVAQWFRPLAEGSA